MSRANKGFRTTVLTINFFNIKIPQIKPFVDQKMLLNYFSLLKYWRKCFSHPNDLEYKALKLNRFITVPQMPKTSNIRLKLVTIPETEQKVFYLRSDTIGLQTLDYTNITPKQLFQLSLVCFTHISNISFRFAMRCLPSHTSKPSTHDLQTLSRYSFFLLSVVKITKIFVSTFIPTRTILSSV